MFVNQLAHGLNRGLVFYIMIDDEVKAAQI